MVSLGVVLNVAFGLTFFFFLGGHGSNFQEKESH